MLQHEKQMYEFGILVIRPVLGPFSARQKSKKGKKGKTNKKKTQKQQQQQQQ